MKTVVWSRPQILKDGTVAERVCFMDLRGKCEVVTIRHELARVTEYDTYTTKDVILN